MGKDSKTTLLALIYQHLLRKGYAKTARELQIESGEKFSTHKLTLNNIYIRWKKKKKKQKKSREHGKKAKVRDTASSKGPGDAALPKEAGGKKRNLKRGKVKLEKDKSLKAAGMLIENSKVNGSPVNVQKEVIQSTRMPEDHGNTGTLQPSLPMATEMAKTPQPADDRTVNTSNKDTKPKKTHSQSLKSTIKSQPVTPSLSIPVTAGKAKTTAPPSPSDTSESDSDSDTEKVKQLTVSIPKVASPSAAAVGKSPLSTVLKPGAESSSEDEESGSDEEPVKTVPKASTGTPMPKKELPAPKPDATVGSDSSEMSDSEEEEAHTKPVVATPRPATPAVMEKGKPQLPATGMPASGQVSATAKPDATDGSETSDSEEEEMPKPVVATPKPATPAVTAKGKKQLPAAGKPVPGNVLPTPKPDATDSSATSDSDEEEEKQDPKSAVAAPKPTAPAITAKGRPQPSTTGKPVPGKVSATPKPDTTDSSETSESEEEQVAANPKPVVATPAVQAKGRPQQSATGKSLPGKMMATPKTDATDSSETSDSEEEQVAANPKPVAISKPLAPAVEAKGKPQPSTTGKALPGNALATPKPNATDSSETSDSEEEEMEKAKPVVTPKLSMPLIAGKGKPVPSTPLKPAEDSSSEDSESDSDQEPIKTAHAAPASIGKAVPGKVIATPKSNATDSSETSDSEEEEKAKPKPVVATPKPVVMTKGKPQLPASGKPVPGKVLATAKSDATDSSDSSDSEEEEKAKPKLVKPAIPVKVRLQLSTTGSLVPGKPVATPKPDATDSSDTSDSEEEKPKPRPRVLAASKAAAAAALAAKAKPQTSAIAKTAPGNVLSPKPKASDSSETSDTEEEEEAAKPKSVVAAPRTATPALTGKQKPPLSTAGKAAPSKLLATPKPDVTDTSDTSDSEEEEQSHPKPVVSAPKPATPAVTAKGKQQLSTVARKVTPAKVLAAPKPAPADSSETYDSEEEKMTKHKPVATTAKPVTPAAIRKVPLTAAPKPGDESSSEDSGSDSDDEPASTMPAASPAAAAAKENTASSDIKTADLEQSVYVSETSDFSEDDLPVAQISSKSTSQAAKTILQPGSTTKAKLGTPAVSVRKPTTATQNSGSSSSSDSEEEQIQSQKSIVLAKQKISAPTSLTTPTSKVSTAKGGASLPTKTPPTRNPAPALVSESSDTDSDEAETTKVASVPKTTGKTNTGSTGKLAKPAIPAIAKSSPVKAAAALKQDSAKILSKSPKKAALKPTPVLQKSPPTASAGKVNPAQLYTESTSEDSDSDSAKPPVKPTATPAKKKLFSQSSTPAVTKPPARGSSDSSSSDSEEEEVPASSQRSKNKSPVKKIQVSPGKGDKKAAGTLQKRAAGTMAEAPQSSGSQHVAEIKANEAQGKTPKFPPKNIGKKSKGETQPSKLSALGTPAPVRSVEDRSVKELAASQPLFDEPVAEKSTPKKRKRAPEMEPPKKTKTQPVPTSPSVLDSEEETLLALFEGRSPKRAKIAKSKEKKQRKKELVEIPLVKAATVQNNGPAGAHPTMWVPDSPSSGDQAVTLPPAVATKSGKKHKVTSEDEPARLAKKAKKKKEKSKSDLEEAPTSSPKKNKDKSEEKKSEKKKLSKVKKDKKQKEGTSGISTPVIESADSGISLVSKSEKKKLKTAKKK